ncbi:unnamed protein product [Lampetra planeri]
MSAKTPAATMSPREEDDSINPRAGCESTTPLTMSLAMSVYFKGHEWRALDVKRGMSPKDVSKKPPPDVEFRREKSQGIGAEAEEDEEGEEEEEGCNTRRDPRRLPAASTQPSSSATHGATTERGIID